MRRCPGMDATINRCANAASSCQAAVRAVPQQMLGSTDGLQRMSGRVPRRRGDTQSIIMSLANTVAVDLGKPGCPSPHTSPRADHPTATDHVTEPTNRTEADQLT